ncbi:uncharacterized protein LOC135462029 [Liolophura sinensis]|uniref:uncharacterized protein LOC135462029 n=1 Tax=Liolophura sinensis TaxID=3198878 RepID=UPI00315915BE
MTIGSSNTETVTEEAFINYMQRFPKETLEEILTVDIIPITVRRDISRELEAEKNKVLHDAKVAEREKLVAEMEAEKSKQKDSQATSPVDIPPVSPMRRPVPSGKPLTDELLLNVVRAIPPKADWHLLANRLGFLQREIEALEINYSESRENMLHSMLRAWRNRGQLSSSAPTLQRALEYCRMDKAAKVLSGPG